MFTKSIGEPGTKIPAIGLGMTGLGALNPARLSDKIHLLREAFDYGLTFFDTADLYAGGQSEEILGQIVKGQRQRAFIATKFYLSSSDVTQIDTFLANSLRRLDSDYVDLYQVHWPHPDVNYLQVCERLEMLRTKGLIRHFGLSNFQAPQISKLQDYFTKGLVSLQAEFNLMERGFEHEIKSLPKNKLATLCYSPLNQGRVSCCASASSALAALATECHSTPAALVLSWIISKPNFFAITKCSSTQHLQDLKWALENPITSEQARVLEDLTTHRPEPVSLDQLCVRERDKPRFYFTQDEAQRNHFDLIPSPVDLARLINEQNFSIHLKAQAHDEKLWFDSYDINDQAKKFWAWKIAKPHETTIPAVILK